MGTSILQSWVMEMGLRHQGVILAAIRGCDTIPKHDESKRMSRFIRGSILVPHCGDIRKSATFMEAPRDSSEFYEVAKDFINSFDSSPHHFVMHFIHASQILGEYHSDEEERERWTWFYERCVHKLHMRPETREHLDSRLGADEETFRNTQVLDGDIPPPRK